MSRSKSRVRALDLVAAALAITAADLTQGARTAEVTLVEYVNLGCPHCRAADPVIQDLLSTYGKQLRVVTRFMPFGSPSEPDFIASAALLAAVKQDPKHFRPMIEAIYKNQAHLDKPNLFIAIATQIGLDTARFEKDLSNPTLIKQVENDARYGTESGVMGTPTIFLNGYLYNDDVTVRALSSTIDSMIAGEVPVNQPPSSVGSNLDELMALLGAPAGEEIDALD